VRGLGYPGDLIIPVSAVNEPPHAIRADNF